MARFEMTVYPHSFPTGSDCTRSKVVFTRSFRTWHRIVPVFNIGSYQIEDPGKGRDEQIPDIVFSVYTELSKYVSQTIWLADSG